MKLSSVDQLEFYLDQQLDLNRRNRCIRRVSQALIRSLRIEECAFIAIRLNSQPAAHVADAVEAFVRRESCALAADQIERCFDVFRCRLRGRLADLLDPD